MVTRAQGSACAQPGGSSSSALAGAEAEPPAAQPLPRFESRRCHGPLTNQVVHVLDVCFGGRLHGRLPLLHASPRPAGKRKRTGGAGGSGGSASSTGPQTRQRTRVRRD
jgi:hypothetical protein